MQVLLLSDLHANLPALERVLAGAQKDYVIDACILLGDLIDYGLRSNEVVERISALPWPVLVNIRGNHEQAILTGDDFRFSSERGRRCAQYTKSTLSEQTLWYLQNEMAAAGQQAFELDGKQCLAVHGSLPDPFWKSIAPGQQLDDYRAYDYVFSGHSHRPHCFEVFFSAEDPIRRGQKKTVFLNPGSVGQPRNLNPCAQFAVLDTVTGAVQMQAVPYEIEKAQADYHGQVDDFYRSRLEYGV